MSDNARHAMYYIPESNFGVTPADPAFLRLRGTGTTLGITKSSSVSDEQRPDRQITDFRHGTEELGGDISFELSFGSQDDLIEAALGGTWSEDITPIVDDTGISVTDTNEFTHASDDWDTDLGFVVGQKFTTTGFTEAGNNGTFTVASIAGTVMTVVETTLTVEAAGDNIGITTAANVLLAGTERRSFTVLRHFSDQESSDKPYHVHTGVELNTLALNIVPDARVTGSFGTTGQSLDPKTTAEWTTILGSGSLGSPSTTKVFDAFTGSVSEGGSLNDCVTEISLTLENGLESRFVVGSKTSKRPSIGRSNITGQITLYFEDSDAYEKFLDETESSLEFTLTDKAGNSYEFTLPRIVFNGGQPDSQGATGSITIALPFQAVYDDTVGSNIRIRKIPA